MILYYLAYQTWAKQVAQTPTTQITASSTSHTETNVENAPKGVEPIRLSPWKSTMTTLFWVGETADADNAYITNTQSYWDEQWQEHYGGVDSPNCRIGFLPCSFVPNENPFYFALPYAEYDESGNLKETVRQIPWYGKDTGQVLKNRWIVVRHGGSVCYGQWEDVGPNNEDDFGYVFGSAKPSNTFGEKAGLDVSPALWRCLQMSDNDVTEWAFVDAGVVPEGPWKDTVTTSGTSWTD